MKIAELVTELKLSDKEFYAFLQEVNIRLKRNVSKLDPGLVTKIKKLYAMKQRKLSEKSVPTLPKEVSMREKSVKVKDLAGVMGVSLPDIMRVCLEKGMLLNINSEVDQTVICELASGLGITVEFEETEEEEKIELKSRMLDIEGDSEKVAKSLSDRPPVIAVMGHVDHGKTTLLDRIRTANVAGREAGGITQHIGAYQVESNGKKLTFLDTPGHEAFTALRARGAQITDIAVLVVAADEGLKPQTIEAISHVQAADVPIVVAINKIDKPEADIERCKQELSQHNLLAEDWGGDVVMVGVSAKTGEGIESFLEMLGIVSDVLELKANYAGNAKSVVIESYLSKQKGATATVLVKTGTLKKGDNFVIGGIIGKVRALFNDRKEPIQKVSPGMPAELLGMQGVPVPGDVLEVKNTEKECRAAAEQHILAKTKENQHRKQNVSLEALSNQGQEGDSKQLNLIVKADVNGSLEAIKASVEKIEVKDVTINLLQALTGDINESDMLLARASRGIVMGLGVQANGEARRIAEEDGTTIKLYTVIYELIQDIEKAVKGLYRTEYEEVETARLEVRQVFSFSKVGKIAGCHVKTGKVTRNDMMRVFRGDDMLFDGKIDSLKRFKDDVKEVQSGFECGVVLEKFSDLKEGDKLVSYQVREKS